MKISYPYLESLAVGDLPRAYEFNTIIHEEAEVGGQRTTTFVSGMIDI
jgi:hypothetical protein